MPINRPLQDELATQFAEGDPATRIATATRLLDMAKKRQDITYTLDTLTEALDDPNEELRLIVARAVVRPTIGPLLPGLKAVEEQLEASDPGVATEAAEALIACARTRLDRHAIAQHLFPMVVTFGRSQTTSAKKSRFLAMLGPFLRAGANPGLVLDSLTEAIKDPNWKVIASAAELIGHCALEGLDVSASRPVLEKRLGRGGTNPSAENAAIQMSCAQALGSMADDTEIPERLLHHNSDAVREGGLTGLIASGALLDHIGLLAECLCDVNGGVVFRAMRGLRHAHSLGADIAPAIPLLESLLNSSSYSRDGWVLQMDMTLSSDLVDESPARDAAGTLARHHLKHRDRDALIVLLRHDGPMVSASARHILTQLAAEPDEIRRRWIEITLKKA
jgi:hypothetical protein